MKVEIYENHSVISDTTLVVNTNKASDMNIQKLIDALFKFYQLLGGETSSSCLMQKPSTAGVRQLYSS